MNIAIHCNQFDSRGAGKVPYDYGVALRDILGHTVTFITSQQNKNEGLVHIHKEFSSILYDLPPAHLQSPPEQVATKKFLEEIIQKYSIDFLHMIKSGENDNITPDNCRTGVHCVFQMYQPHGSVYAGVSEYLARKYQKSAYVPHIIKPLASTENYREKFNIPDSAFVFGRHGGNGQFNIPFVKDAVRDILEYRKDCYFIFLSTDPFIFHERVIYIPRVSSQQDVYNFIHSCDAMLHARADGETFGLSIGEFSSANKPVLTWSGLLNDVKYPKYDTCHLDLLEDRAIIYNDYKDLLDTLYSIDKSFVDNHEWDKYSHAFSPNNIMRKYSQTFLT